MCPAAWHIGGRHGDRAHLKARARRLVSSPSVRSFSCRSRSRAAHGFFLNTLLAPAVGGIGFASNKARTDDHRKMTAGWSTGYCTGTLSAEGQTARCLCIKREDEKLAVHCRHALVFPTHEPAWSHASSIGKARGEDITASNTRCWFADGRQCISAVGSGYGCAAPRTHEDRTRYQNKVWWRGRVRVGKRVWQSGVGSGLG